MAPVIATLTFLDANGKLAFFIFNDMLLDPFGVKPMHPWQLQKKLTLFSEREIDLVINDNRSTFLSVLQKGRKKMKISLHKLFLHACDNVCEAVITFSLKKDPNALRKIRFFANTYFAKANFSADLDEHKLWTEGKCYHLKEIYQLLNKKYFQNKLDLKITWFKKPKYRTFSSFTFGSYNHPLRLIRINEILDHSAIPPFFIEYVIYHEMLHHVCPGYTDEQGREWIHTALFKKKEKEFLHYNKAKLWEKKATFFWK